MAKKKVMFECMACGYESPKWLGKCPNCGAWNQMEEQLLAPGKKASSSRSLQFKEDQPLGRAYPLAEIETRVEDRMSTQFNELDRVLGGGLVAGSLVLIGGDPGIGKSTLLLQVSIQLVSQGQKVLYVSGEESLSQIKLRADRLKVQEKDLYLMAETDLDQIVAETSRVQPDVVMVDSIQTMHSPDHNGVSGSVGQVRQATASLMRLAKDNQMAIFIVGHVTKEGSIAGPRLLEHLSLIHI